MRLGSSIRRLICETIQLLFLAAGDQVTGDQRFLTRSHYFSKTASENVSKVSVHLHSLQKNYWRPKIENKWEAPKLRKRNLLSHHHHHHHHTQFQLQNQRNLVKTQIRNQSNHRASSAMIRDLVESWFCSVPCFFLHRNVLNKISAVECPLQGHDSQTENWCWMKCHLINRFVTCQQTVHGHKCLSVLCCQSSCCWRLNQTVLFYRAKIMEKELIKQIVNCEIVVALCWL